MMRRLLSRGGVARAPPPRVRRAARRPARDEQRAGRPRGRVRGRDGRWRCAWRARTRRRTPRPRRWRSAASALAVSKYWVCKRGAPFAAEALECLGGNGYIETMEAPVAQFYRDIQIGTVWEGSGNVIALDVLRAMARSPECVPAFLAECETARGADAALRRAPRPHARVAWPRSATAADPQWIARRARRGPGARAPGLAARCATRRRPSPTRSAPRLADGRGARSGRCRAASTPTSSSSGR